MVNNNINLIAANSTDAFEIANKIVKDYTLDVKASENAGYNIYRSESEYYDYVCDLCDRLEINLHNGQTINIHIEYTETKQKEKSEIAELKLEILKLKAKLYDILIKEND